MMKHHTWLMIQNAVWISKVFWLFHQITSSAVKWRHLLSTPFIAWSYACCTSLLKATWSTCCTDIFLSWMPVLFVATCTCWQPGGSTMLLCLLAVMWIVIWTMIMNEVHRALPLSSHHLAAFFLHQLKFKIRVERERLSSKEFVESWMNDADDDISS